MARIESVLPQPLAAPADWGASIAWRYRRRSSGHGTLEPVRHVAAMSLEALKEIDVQKEKIERNTRQFVEGKPANALAAYVMGLAFAFGWTPCIGPVLGPILTLAGGRETVGEGALLLAAYSLGLGIPFLIAAVFSGAFMRFLQTFRVHLGRVEKAIGALLVVAGVFFLSGGVQTVSYWLLETFPVLGRLG